MKSYASNSPLRRFRLVVLSVADDRVADRWKLDSDPVLQSRHQRNSDERRGAKTAFDEIPKFSTNRLGAALGGQPLKHSFSSKVNERPFFDAEMSANHPGVSTLLWEEHGRYLLPGHAGSGVEGA